MIYDHSNVIRGAVVTDHDAQKPIAEVMSVDTEKGEVTCCEHPLRVVSGDVAKFVIRFKTIEVLYEREIPSGFVCRGRLP